MISYLKSKGIYYSQSVLFIQDGVGGNPSFNPCDGAGVSGSLQKYELCLKTSPAFFLVLVACDLPYNFFF